MKTRHLLSLGLLSMGILFGWTACSGKTETPQTETPTAEATTPPAEIDSTVAEVDSTAIAETDEPTATDEVVTPVATLPTGKVGEDRMAIVLANIATELEAQNLEYRSDLGQDCSGIFHKIKDLIQKRISDLGNSEAYTYPSFAADRNSRQIAHWYYENGNLMIIQDAKASRNQIRPGSVMFFGRTEEKYSKPDINLLTNPGKFVHDGTNGKIMHIAVVTEVEKDEAGNVIKYTMMHGRNSKYPASRSAGNYDGPGGYKTAFAKFPFGNWNQQWVAVAQIATPKQ